MRFRRFISQNYARLVAVIIITIGLAGLLMIADQNRRGTEQRNALIEALKHQHQEQNARLACIVKLFTQRREVTVRDVDRCIVDQLEVVERQEASAARNDPASPDSNGNPATPRPTAKPPATPPDPPDPPDEDPMVIDIIEGVINILPLPDVDL